MEDPRPQPDPEPLQINVVEAEDFYEKIEAPKFVDLTAPDHYPPGDDRYWFCLRVGCDQKHEEELDSEAIYKNFLLRVMAARSPNVRLRKALYRKDSSTSLRCPQTVPAKPSRSRVTRLALISSLSKTVVDPKSKAKPLSKQFAETPSAKVKQSSVAAKALTTPGNKKQPTKQCAFRSVRKPKETSSDDVPKNRTIAKALVFHSPKKPVRTKMSQELKTPVKTLCAEMKKLQITSGKKYVLGYSRPLPSDASSRKPPRGREVKSRVYDGLRTPNRRGQQPNSSKGFKKNDFSDMESGEKSSNGSQKLYSTSNSDEADTHQESSTTMEVSTPPLHEKKVDASSDTSRSELNSLSSIEGRDLGDTGVANVQAPSGEGNENSDNKDQEEKKVSRMKGTNEAVEIEDERHTLTSDDKENEGGFMESNEKENASVSDANRVLNRNTDHLQRKALGKHGTPKSTKEMRKSCKENSATVATGVQRLKHGKPRPTSPKPFRLRTDERCILKEANSEKKLPATLLKEITSASKLPRGKSQKKQQHTFPRHETSLEQTENDNDTNGSSRKESNTIQNIASKNGNMSLKTEKGRVGQKLSLTPQRHTVSSQQKLAVKKLGSSLKKTKTPLLRPISRTQETVPCTEEIPSLMTPVQLGVIQETSETSPRSKEATTKPKEYWDAPPVVKTFSGSPASRLSLQGKRFTTKPKEPNFHTVHVPTNCTRRAI